MNPIRLFSTRNPPPVLFLAGLALLLAGCASSPRTHFYTLGAPEKPHTIGFNPDGVRLGLWRVQLPEMLDRTEIVTREGRFHIKLAELHRWAERLDDNISRVIAHELARRLDTDNISVSPWPAHVKNDYQLRIRFSRFDGALGGEIVISGTWHLLDRNGTQALAKRSFRYAEHARGPEYTDMIASLNRLTRQLAADIAAHIPAQAGGSRKPHGASRYPGASGSRFPPARERRLGAGMTGG